MTPTPLNLDTLDARRFLQLDASRQFLVAPAIRKKAAPSQWKIHPAGLTAGQIKAITHTFVFGDVTIVHSREWVSVRHGDTNHWNTNTLDFSGRPKLTVVHTATEVTIALSGARFAGLSLTADFTARLTLANGAAQIALSFPFAAFAANAPLAAWLDRATPLATQVFWDDTLCRLTDGVSLRAAGVATARFLPGWLFSFAASRPFVALATEGSVVASRQFSLAPLAREMPSLLPNPARRRSVLLVPEENGFRLPLWPERAAGWQFKQPEAAFRCLTIENNEETDGDIRRALLAWGDAEDRIAFATGGGLRDTAGEPFSIPLSLPIYSAAYAGDGRRLGASLIAARPTKPVTCHTERCSLVLGALRDKPAFCLLDIPGTLYLGSIPRKSVLVPGLRFHLVGTALRPLPLIDDSTRPVLSDPLPPPQISTITLCLGGTGLPLQSEQGRIELHDDAPAHITLPENLLMQLIRPSDLMVLDYWFCRARPVLVGAAGHIIPGNEGNPRVVVILPPQNIGEATVPETEDNKAELPDDSAIPLGPIAHRAAAPSRLAFAFPTGADALPFTLAQLLDWSAGTMPPIIDQRAARQTTLPPISVIDPQPGLSLGSSVAAAVTPPSGAVQPMMNIPPKPPAPDTTAIEAPYRLIISPDQFGAWTTVRTDPAAARTIPWLTRLSSRITSDEHPPVRGIWTVGHHDGIPASQLGARTSLKDDNRQQIVANCRHKPVDARRLMLSSLGAWLDLHGDWAEVPGVTLERWLHRTTLGRDQYVETVERGYLFPFGHKAVKITISERKFGQHPPGRLGAWLYKRTFIVVREPVRDYAADVATTTVFAAPHSDGRELPFRQVRIVTKVTPLLDPAQLIADFTDSEYQQKFPSITINAEDKPDTNFWPHVRGLDFYFSLSATDWAGHSVEFSAPLAFVRYDVAQLQSVVTKVLAHQLQDAPIGGGDKTRRFRYPLRGQPVAFAQPAPGATAANTSLEVESLDFEGFAHSAWAGASATRPVYPRLTRARAVAPLHRQFAGMADPANVVFHDAYLQNGLGTGGVFLRYEDPQDCTFGSANSTDKVGGIVTPGVRIGGISQKHGLVGIGNDASLGDIASQLNGFNAGTFTPQSYFGGVSAKLLGGIDLKDLLAKVAGATDSQIPRWLSERDGNTVTRRLEWSTQQLTESTGIVFDYYDDPAIGKATLGLKCVAHLNTATGAANTRVTAALNNFAVDLENIIKVPFKKFTLEMEVGRKPAVAVDVGEPTFCGGLAFLQRLQSALGVDEFTKGSGIEISAAGVSIGYSIALPTIAVGVFSLQNLAISTAATLPFNGDPFRLRFAICERQNPFIVTVSIFGGGGFFALAAGIDGIDTLEIALEFGGNFTLDIGIASGGAHVMAGLYFKVAPTGCKLTGYVRAGGELNVLGLISISCEFYLGLTYENQLGKNKAWGEASLTVEISVLFFSFDVTLTVRREFAGDDSDPNFGDTITTADWNNYLEAFAN